MSKLIPFIIAAFFASLAAGFFIQLRAPIDPAPIKAAMLEAAGQIDLNPPAVNMEVQTIDLDDLQKLRLREFTYSPTFCADGIEIKGQSTRGLASDSIVNLQPLGP